MIIAAQLWAEESAIGIPAWLATTVSLSCQIPDTCPSQISVKVNLDDSLCKGLSMVPGTIASTQCIFAVAV